MNIILIHWDTLCCSIIELSLYIRHLMLLSQNCNHVIRWFICSSIRLHMRPNTVWLMLSMSNWNSYSKLALLLSILMRRRIILINVKIISRLWSTLSQNSITPLSVPHHHTIRNRNASSIFLRCGYCLTSEQVLLKGWVCL